MLTKQKTSDKLFPQAYITESTTIYQLPKSNRLFVWIIIGLVGLIMGMFSFFQSDLIQEAAKLSEVIR